jgi:hypothetical protein
MLYRAMCSAPLSPFEGEPAALETHPVIFEAESDTPLPLNRWKQALATAWGVDAGTVSIDQVDDAATLAARLGAPEREGCILAALGLPFDRPVRDLDHRARPPAFPTCFVSPRLQSWLWQVWSTHVLRAWPMPWGEQELYEINDACIRELKRYLDNGDPKGHEREHGTVTALWSIHLKMSYLFGQHNLDAPLASPYGSQRLRDLAQRVKALTTRGPEAWPSFPVPAHYKPLATKGVGND